MNYLPLPPGTTVYLSIHGVNRDPNIWGPDADVFRPERWLVNDEGDWDKKGKDSTGEMNAKERDRESLKKAKKEVPSLWSSV